MVVSPYPGPSQLFFVVLPRKKMRSGLFLATTAVFCLLAFTVVLAEQPTAWSTEVELVDDLQQHDALLEVAVNPATIHSSCPPKATRQVGLCTRLLTTIAVEGGVKTVLGAGEDVCAIARFAFEDLRMCAKVYDHIAEVGQSWDLDAHFRGNTPVTFCINVLAEPVQSIALLSPRTERKCLGTKTADDDKFDMEPAAPDGYTGNILEDPFGSNIYYLNGCKCTCKKCTNCGGAKAPVDRVVPLPKPQKHKTPLPKPLPPPTPAAQCKKGDFPYSFPYSQYLPSANDVHVVADFELQKMRVYQGATVVKEYTMSSSEVGIGSAPGSLRSPSGKFRIAELVGEGAKIGADFKNLKPTGRFSKPSDKAAVQTRVLVLEGEDAGNANTRSRKIYIHGTNKKASLGLPSSQGCFRLSNEDITDLFGRVKAGTKFFAIPKCGFVNIAPVPKKKKAGLLKRLGTKLKNKIKGGLKKAGDKLKNKVKAAGAKLKNKVKAAAGKLGNKLKNFFGFGKKKKL